MNEMMEAVNEMKGELPLSRFHFDAQEIKFLSSSFQLIAYLSLEMGRIDLRFRLERWIFSKEEGNIQSQKFKFPAFPSSTLIKEDPSGEIFSRKAATFCASNLACSSEE